MDPHSSKKDDRPFALSVDEIDEVSLLAASKGQLYRTESTLTRESKRENRRRRKPRSGQKSPHRSTKGPRRRQGSSSKLRKSRSPSSRKRSGSRSKTIIDKQQTSACPQPKTINTPYPSSVELGSDSYSTPSICVVDRSSYEDPSIFTASGSNVSGQVPAYELLNVDGIDGTDSTDSEFSSEECEDTGRQWKEWNREFQDLLDMDDTIEKWEGLSQLATDFAYAARTYGRIIISEVMLSDEHKTIKPENLGGVAGGEKYIVQGILFKFSLDLHNIYGGDEKSAKAAAAELRGNGAIYECRAVAPELRIPLSALIDYRGFRLVAVSLVPISQSTLAYGSADGCATVHCQPRPRAIMEQVGKTLNLRPHLVGGQTMVGPGDIEIHVSKRGECYAIDTARLFPAEAPYLPPATRPPRKAMHLYRLLRPEFVKTWRGGSNPLSSDAFSKFQLSDPNCKAMNADVQEATLYLYQIVIPAYASKITNSAGDSTALEELIQAHSMHRAGINMRMLGCVRAALIDAGEARSRACDMILAEIIARTLKNLLRKRLRSTMRSVLVASQEPYTKCILRFYNLILGNQPGLGDDSLHFWNVAIKKEVLSRYANALTEKEQSLRYDLFAAVRGDSEKPADALLTRIMSRLQQLSHKRLTKLANRQLKEYITSFVVTLADIKEPEAEVKQLNIVYYAQGSALMIRATSPETSTQEAARLWDMAELKFERAVRSSSDSSGTLTQWGSLLLHKAWQLVLGAVPTLEGARSGLPLHLVKTACDKFRTAALMPGMLSRSQVLLGRALCLQAALHHAPSDCTDQDALFSTAARHFASSLGTKSGEELVENLITEACTNQGMLLALILRVACAAAQLVRSDHGTVVASSEASTPLRALSSMIISGLKGMRPVELDIRGSVAGSALSDDAFELLYNHMKGATVLELDLSNNPLLTSHALRSAARLFPAVEVIVLLGCSTIDESGLVNLAQSCTRLSKLMISPIAGADMAALTTLLRSYTKGASVVVQLSEFQRLQSLLDAQDVSETSSEDAKAMKSALEMVDLKLRMMGLGGVSAAENAAAVLAYDDRMKVMSVEDMLSSLRDNSTNAVTLKQLLMAYSERPAVWSEHHVKTLESLLLHPHDDVRVWTVVCLMKIGDGRCADSLLAIIESDHDRFVKEAICVAMALFHHEPAVPSLVQLWRNNPISNVRQAAEVALKTIGGALVEDAFGSANTIRVQMEGLLKSMMPTTQPLV